MSNDADVELKEDVVPWPWTRKESSKYKGRFYYINEVTKESSWKAPEVPVKDVCKLAEIPESSGSETEATTNCTETEEESSGQSETELEAESPRGAVVAPVLFKAAVSEAPAPAASASMAVAELLKWRASASEVAHQDTILMSAAVVAPAVPVNKMGAAMSSRSSRVSSGMQSSRRRAETDRPSCGWQSEAAAPAPLEQSGSSWAAQLRLKRASAALESPEAIADADVVRKVKTLLNKLTLEKFPQISSQILEIEFTSAQHVKTLIKEVFEKATTQHHYIDMYTDLCELLNEFFSDHALARDTKTGFKRLLLNECQRTFEKNLEPPTDLEKLDLEERQLAEMRYKTRMLGCIRFVGALLSRQMLASKVLISIVEDLMFDPIPEALETLVALLTVAGPVFDTSDWQYHEQLDATFAKLKKMSSEKACVARLRCLITDLLELRAHGWKDCGRPKRAEAPSTLEAVAAKAKMETRVSLSGVTRSDKSWMSRK